MRTQGHGNARQFASVTVKNAEATATIQDGAPIFFKHDTTGTFGLDVISSEDLSLVKQTFFAGIALAAIPASGYGDGNAFGMVNEARIFLRSRAASTDVWAAYASSNIGERLTVMTNTNAAATFQCWDPSGVEIVAARASSTDAVAVAAINNYDWAWDVRLAESIAAAASLASGVSTPSSNVLVSTVLLKAMIRNL